MIRFGAIRRPYEAGARYGRIVCAATAVLLLAGCSSTPDWANPVEWYNGASDALFGSDSGESASAKSDAKTADSADKKAGDSAEAKKDEKVPGSDQPFPNLASVPDRPKAPSEAQQQQMADSLKADRENARYTEDEIKRQSDVATSPLPSQAEESAPAPAQAQASSAPSTKAPAPAEMSGTSASSAPAPTPAMPQSPPPQQMTSSSPQPSSSTMATMSPQQAVGPNPPSQPPHFAPPPAPPAAVPKLRMGTQPTGTVSVARIGNPRFGPAPADIAAAEDSGGSATHMQAMSDMPQPAGTVGANTGVPGERAAIIKFAAGSSALSASEKRRIRIVAQLYQKRGGAIRVEGHASSQTHDMTPLKHEMVNFDVSLKRANAVAHELERNGVPSQSIFVAAMSDTQPIYYEVMPAGVAGNQRVEIYFVN